MMEREDDCRSQGFSRMRDLIESYLNNCNPATDSPTIILSWAQSVDGCLSLKEGEPSAISCPESLILTHTIRSLCQGILVGINTILSDDPILTCRLEGSTSSPIPVILDSKLRTPLKSRILDRSPIICTTKDADSNIKDLLEKHGAQIEVIDKNSKGSIDLHRARYLAGKYGIDLLMVEGGAQVLQGFLHKKLGHVIILTIAPKFFGNSGSFSSKESGVVLPFEIKSAIFKQIGVDMVMIGYPLFI